ncbi:MAG: hypothetical protein EHM41_18465 [Chloroflexi bacterium]|nr:MAG: hypothetical protein EHM41_18465 [Chloroflexota bacterium]
MKIISNKTIFSLGLVSAGIASYLFALRPRFLSWGTSRGAVKESLPGDKLVPDHRLLIQTTRTVTIPATDAVIWPWLVQIGQGRAGFYSYDWLENLFGMDIHNTDRILPNLQNLKVGDQIPFWKGVGVEVKELEPGCWLVMAGSIKPDSDEIGGTWTFILAPTGKQTTRLIIRTRVADFPPHWLSKLFSLVLLEPAHFIMERKMMMGIRDRVVRANEHSHLYRTV